MAPDLWENLLSLKGRNASPENTCTPSELDTSESWDLKLCSKHNCLWNCEGQGSLASCSPRGHKEWHDLTTEQQQQQQQQQLGIREICEFYFKREERIVRVWTLYELANAASQTIPKFWDWKPPHSLLIPGLVATLRWCRYCFLVHVRSAMGQEDNLARICWVLLLFGICFVDGWL